MSFARPTIVFFVAGICLLGIVGCNRKSDSSPLHNPSVNSQEDYQKAKDAALEESRKEYEQRMANPQTNNTKLVAIPNFDVGYDRAIQTHLNFYESRDCFPAYLLCYFPVKETNYAEAKEPEWFKLSLEQIRHLGKNKYPPFERVAVCIQNVTEHTGASTFEKSHKVAALFDATNVFNPNCDLAQLISRTAVDRHPFFYDTTQPTPGEQQRWLIVERDAAKKAITNAPPR